MIIIYVVSLNLFKHHNVIAAFTIQDTAEKLCKALGSSAKITPIELGANVAGFDEDLETACTLISSLASSLAKNSPDPNSHYLENWLAGITAGVKRS